ncbi:MAG: glutathione S-transferase [Parvibaculum sp.]|uniref:glutathione S-transferase family protein n=1 Tax=Parvibaculum sp. TaxID=2024848 RepID=UPI003C73CC06
MTQGYTLYGAEPSYYSGKVRAYLRYKRIPFAEFLNTPDAYRSVILPRVGWPVIPVVITPEDETLQDSTEIIDELETRFPEAPIYPATVKQRLAALLLEVYADEWLKIPAMHYRWNRNYDFAIAEFGKMSAPGADAETQHAAGLKISKPFAGALPFLGVTPKTEAAIEQSYEGLLGELDKHFAVYEFLFGTRPSIGDFGLIGPLYAHQYRDPASGALMKSIAPNVARWVEGMMKPPHPKGGEFLPRDEVPETLIPVLARMMREMVPVLVSTAHHLQKWVDENPEDRRAGAEVPRAIGMHVFSLGDAKENRAIFPFDLWMLQRPLDYIANLEADDRLRAADLLRQAGGETLMEFPSFPRLTRRNFKIALA